MPTKPLSLFPLLILAFLATIPALAFGQTVQAATGEVKLDWLPKRGSLPPSLVTFDVVSDASGNVYADIDGFFGTILLAIFDPLTYQGQANAQRPDDNWDATLKQRGIDAFKGKGQNLSNETAASAIVLETSGTMYLPVAIGGPLVLELSGMGASNMASIALLLSP